MEVFVTSHQGPELMQQHNAAILLIPQRHVQAKVNKFLPRTNYNGEIEWLQV